MKKTLHIALLSAGLFLAQSSHAINILNGTETNGIAPNALHMNTITLNALNMNALNMNGVATQGITLNGLTTSNGIRTNALTTNAQQFQSAASDCAQPVTPERCRQFEAAPHFSAIELPR